MKPAIMYREAMNVILLLPSSSTSPSPRLPPKKVNGISDNYSLKFRGSLCAFFQGVTKNFQMVTSIAINLKTHTHACIILIMACTPLQKSFQATETARELFPAMYTTFAHIFFKTLPAVMDWLKLWCALMIPKAYSSKLVFQCRTNHKFGVHGIHFMCQRCTFVCNN